MAVVVNCQGDKGSVNREENGGGGVSRGGGGKQGGSVNITGYR